jgi:HEAT repeat protein
MQAFSALSRLIAMTQVGLALGLVYTVLYQLVVQRDVQGALLPLAAILLLSCVNILLVMAFHLAHIGREGQMQSHRKRHLPYWRNLWNEASLQKKAPALNKQALRDPLAFDTLLEMSKYPSPSHLSLAETLYEQLGLLERDLKLLQSSSAPVREKALERLARCSHPDALPYLVKLIKQSDPSVRRLALLVAARAAANLPSLDDELAEQFSNWLNDDKLAIGYCQNVLVALERNALPVVEVILQPASAHPRVSEALEAVGLLRLDSMVFHCLYWLESPIVNQRVSAIRALAGLNRWPPITSQALYLALDDPAWEVRAQAALAVTRSSHPGMEEKLYNMLGDSQWWVRHNAAQALGQRGELGQRWLQMAIQTHSDRYARQTAQQYLSLRDSSQWSSL